MKRVVIAAGGTGGHFYPGLVTALELKARGWEPLLIVKKDDPAKARLEAAGLARIEVDLRGLPRSIGPELITFTVKLLGSLRLLSNVVRDYKPSLVVGMGGYLTFPCAYGAWRRGVPIALHESNTILGLANKASRALGARLFWGLPPFNGGKAVVVGTPIRPELFTRGDTASARRKLGLDPAKTTILVFGGSQGAQGLNLGFAAALKSSGQSPQVLHLAGKGKGAETSKAYADAGVTAEVREYCEDMAAAYAASDFVVCRSGASTLAELAAQGKHSILIPFPHAAANHQDYNARLFERICAAERVPDAEIATRLGRVLADMLDSLPPAHWSELGLPPADRATGHFVDELEKLS